MSDKVLVGIIAYNDELTIDDTIKSILQQKTEFDFKIHIIDDASTDNTVYVLKAYKEKYPSVIELDLFSAHIGKYGSIIKLLKNADTEYFTYLYGDDIWYENDRLQYQVDVLDNNKDFSVCLCQTHYIRDNIIGDPLIPKHFLNTKYSFKRFFQENLHFNNSGTLFRRNSLNNEFISDMQCMLNTFEECSIDTDLLILMCLKSGPMCILSKVVSLIRYDNKNKNNSATKAIINAIKSNYYRKYFANRFSELSPYMDKFFDIQYNEMWKCLINENYVVPIYKLSKEENYLLDRLKEDIIRNTINKRNIVTRKNPTKYAGEVNTRKRFLSIGFDDFRDSDFSLVAPLFAKYGYGATFNRISVNMQLSYEHISQMDYLLENGHEIGDHTWFHANFLFDDPLFNGQDPNNLEGNQKVFPSNEDMREDRGDGKNAFGIDLNEPVKKKLHGGYAAGVYAVWPNIDTQWRGLSNAECQIIREVYSVYKDKTGILYTLDTLSNRYLGTYGKSVGSFDAEKGCYTGGIFTGAKTSANHEIWERILEVTKLFYHDQYGEEFNFSTWSFPGSIQTPFVYEKNNQFFYDKECTQHSNHLAKFTSSIANNLNNPRSWIDVLRIKGYNTAHDINFPARSDGQRLPAMSKQLYINARFSKQDVLAYRTERTIHYCEFAKEYVPDYFTDPQKSPAAQMYDGKGEFYRFIEGIRHDTSNGIIHGEMIDSIDTPSERLFLVQMLEYCKKTGVEVIPKSVAYDIAFNHSVVSGNLIYNHLFRNTAQEFFKDAEGIPKNPDGYIGDCHVKSIANYPVLVINEETYYLHYGIPCGKIQYWANIKGYGSINIYAIKNNDCKELNIEKLCLLSSISISSCEEKAYSAIFYIHNENQTEYEQLCEGLGNKIMGVKIIYSAGLEISNINMCLVGSDYT